MVLAALNVLIHNYVLHDTFIDTILLKYYTRKMDHPEKAVFCACVAALLMKFFLFDFMITEGLSMLPAIKPGTILVVIRTAYGFRLPGSAAYLLRWSTPKEGDVVVFFTPRGDTAVKRCNGMVGENAFLALGDNNRESYDSRFYGPVPVDHIIGKVLGIK
jgi:signal peptidase I